MTETNTRFCDFCDSKGVRHKKECTRNLMGATGVENEEQTFVQKEDFDKFVDALKITIDHVKTELMPEVDFSKYQEKDQPEEQVESKSGLDEELSWE